MAFNKDRSPNATTTSLRSQACHWENGDGAQYFSANPVSIDNGDITLVTMQQMETGQAGSSAHDFSNIYSSSTLTGADGDSGASR
jgi:hypothetical protein